MEEVRVNGWRFLIQLDSLGVTLRRVEDLLHPVVYVLDGALKVEIISE